MTETKNQKVLTGNILSFDFGERRVGVAIGNNITNNIHPLETIEASKKIDRYSKIESLLETWKPTQLIVGYPLNDDGSQSRMSSLAKKFGEKLKNKFNFFIIICLLDNILSFHYSITGNMFTSFFVKASQLFSFRFLCIKLLPP